ncbi:MAG TPA: hypothetical protein VFR88_13790, partial [Microlunatus sp.]|nr:hypothetical protein [Microlunatus sp.]
PKPGRGPVARATLYFLLRYPCRIDTAELPADRVTQLLDWHTAFPPEVYERTATLISVLRPRRHLRTPRRPEPAPRPPRLGRCHRLHRRTHPQ